MVPDISVALQQKTANFKVAISSRVMQWSAFISVSLIDGISVSNQMAKN